MKRGFIIFGLLCCFSLGNAQIDKGVKGLARVSKQVSTTEKTLGNVGRVEIGTVRGISTLPQRISATVGEGEGTTVPTQQIQQQVNSSLASMHETLQNAQAVVQSQGSTLNKTPQEWLKEYREHPEKFAPGTPMYNTFKRIYQKVKKGLKTDQTSLEIAQIYQQNTTRTDPAETAKKWLDEYRAHPEELKQGTTLYQTFYQITKKVQAGKRTDAAAIEISRIYLENTTRKEVAKTAEEWLAEYAAHPEELKNGTSMYESFRRITAQVRDGIRTDAASIEISRIYLKNTTRREVAKSAEEWLAEYAAHPEELKSKTPMYIAFSKIALKVKIGEKTDAASLEMARIYSENTKRIAAPKTTQEVYDLFLTYLRDHKSYPLATTTEYVYVYTRLHNRELSKIQADPDLYKLYRLDQLARAARRGEKPWEVFDRDNPLKRSRINGTSPQAQETEIPLEENYAQLSTEEQTVIRQTEEYYEKLWENYPTWFEENKQYIITTTQTQRAFDALNREVQSGRWSDETLEILDVLQNANLGPDGFGSYVRMIYRGNSSVVLRASDFHIVEEEFGLQVPTLGELFPQRIPHIRFAFADGTVSTMILEEGVTTQDVETAIDAFLEHYQTKQTGWSLRMGSHEMGPRPHIHFEFIDDATEGGMDISHVLQLDVRKVIPADSPQARQRTFYRLFSKYINL